MVNLLVYGGNKMKKKSIKKNYIYNLFYQIITVILPVITAPYLSRVIGAEAIGIHSYTVSIYSYFGMAGILGTGIYGQKCIATYQNNVENRSKSFYEIFIIRTISMLITLLIFYNLFARSGEYTYYYKILCIEMFSIIFDISWFYQGLENFKKTVMRSLLIKLLSVALIIILVKQPSDLYLYFYIHAFSTLFANLTLWINLNKYVQKVRIQNIRLKKHLKNTIIFFIPQVAMQVYNILDKTMIGMITNDVSEVGYYENSQKIIKILLGMVTAMGTVLLPRISSYFSNGEENKINDTIIKSFNFVFFISFPIFTGILIVSTRFAPIFFGENFYRTGELMLYISPIIILIPISNILGIQYMLPTDRNKQYTLAIVLASVVNLIFNILLIPKYNGMGASISTVLAELTVVIVEAYYLRKCFNFKNIFKKTKNYILSSLIMFIGCSLVPLLLNNNLSIIIIQIILGIVIYIIMLLILKDEFFMNNFWDKFILEYTRKSKKVAGA